MTVEEAILKELKTLPPDKKQEVLHFTESLKAELKAKGARRSLKGALSHLNIHVTEEDIQEARNEMWRGYTKDTE